MSTRPGSTLAAIADGLIDVLDVPPGVVGAEPKFWLPPPVAVVLSEVPDQAIRPMPRPTSTERPTAPSAMPTVRSGLRRGCWYAGGGTHWPVCCAQVVWPNCAVGPNSPGWSCGRYW